MPSHSPILRPSWPTPTSIPNVRLHSFQCRIRSDLTCPYRCRSLASSSSLFPCTSTVSRSARPSLNYSLILHLIDHADSAFHSAYLARMRSEIFFFFLNHFGLTGLILSDWDGIGCWSRKSILGCRLIEDHITTYLNLFDSGVIKFINLFFI